MALYEGDNPLQKLISLQDFRARQAGAQPSQVQSRPLPYQRSQVAEGLGAISDAFNAYKEARYGRQAERGQIGAAESYVNDLRSIQEGGQVPQPAPPPQQEPQPQPFQQSFQPSSPGVPTGPPPGPAPSPSFPSTAEEFGQIRDLRPAPTAPALDFGLEPQPEPFQPSGLGGVGGGIGGNLPNPLGGGGPEPAGLGRGLAGAGFGGAPPGGPEKQGLLSRIKRGLGSALNPIEPDFDQGLSKAQGRGIGYEGLRSVDANQRIRTERALFGRALSEKADPRRDLEEELLNMQVKEMEKVLQENPDAPITEAEATALAKARAGDELSAEELMHIRSLSKKVLTGDWLSGITQRQESGKAPFLREDAKRGAQEQRIGRETGALNKELAENPNFNMLDYATWSSEYLAVISELNPNLLKSSENMIITRYRSSVAGSKDRLNYASVLLKLNGNRPDRLMRTLRSFGMTDAEAQEALKNALKTIATGIAGEREQLGGGTEAAPGGTTDYDDL